MADGSLEITEEERKRLNEMAKRLTSEAAARKPQPTAAPTTPPSLTSPAAAPYDTGGLGMPSLSSAKPFFSAGGKTPSASGMGEPSTPRLDRGPVTPGLDRLAAMQGTPMGSTSTLNQTRSLESSEGKSLRMARKLQRMGFGGAAEKVALSAASSGMDEPNIKNQEFRGFEEKSKRAATTEAAANEELKRKQFEFQSKLLEQQNKDLASGQFDFRKYAPPA